MWLDADVTGDNSAFYSANFCGGAAIHRQTYARSSCVGNGDPTYCCANWELGSRRNLRVLVHAPLPSIRGRRWTFAAAGRRWLPLLVALVRRLFISSWLAASWRSHLLGAGALRRPAGPADPLPTRRTLCPRRTTLDHVDPLPWVEGCAGHGAGGAVRDLCIFTCYRCGLTCRRTTHADRTRGQRARLCRDRALTTVLGPLTALR